MFGMGFIGSIVNEYIIFKIFFLLFCKRRIKNFILSKKEFLNIDIKNYI